MSGVASSAGVLVSPLPLQTHLESKRPCVGQREGGVRATELPLTGRGAFAQSDVVKSTTSLEIFILFAFLKSCIEIYNSHTLQLVRVKCATPRFGVYTIF